MIAALSPGLSWFLVVSLIIAAALIYAYVVASPWFDAAERDLDESRTWTFTEPRDPNLRIFGGVYDHEADGDFP